MTTWLSSIWVLAEAAKTAAEEAAKTGAKQGAPPCGGPGMMMLPLVGIFVLFYFLILAPQKRDRAKREGFLRALKKNDRVVTIGGIIGTVVGISADEREVTLKVDDNARIKMLRSAIQGPLREEDIETRANEESERSD